MKKHTQYRTLTFETLETREMPSAVAVAGDAPDLLGPTEIIAQTLPTGTDLPGSELNSWGTGNLPWWRSSLLTDGDGNTYNLTESGDSIGRVVWLFAMYYGNQDRVVPEMTTLASAQSEEEWNTNYGLFGTKLSSAVFYDVYPDSQKLKKTPKELLDEDAPQPIEKLENRLELKLNPEMERNFQEPENRKEIPEEDLEFPEEVPIWNEPMEETGTLEVQGHYVNWENEYKPDFTSSSLQHPAISEAQIRQMIHG